MRLTNKSEHQAHLSTKRSAAARCSMQDLRRTRQKQTDGEVTPLVVPEIEAYQLSNFSRIASNAAAEAWECLKLQDASFVEKASFHFARHPRRNRCEPPFGCTPADAASQLLAHGGKELEPLASCIPARAAFQRAIHKSLQRRLKKNADSDVFIASIVLHSGFISDEKTVLNLERLIVRSRYICSKLCPDFVAAADVQSMANVSSPEGGKVTCLHVHAVMFGQGAAERARKKAKFFNKSRKELPFGGEVVTIGDRCASQSSLVRISSYPFRIKPKQKTLYLNPKTGRRNLHESEKGDRMIRFERILEIQSSIELRDIVFAGGRGRKIKTKALHRARAAVVDLPQRPTSKDIKRFWKRWRKATSTKRFRPVIVNRRARKLRR